VVVLFAVYLVIVLAVPLALGLAVTYRNVSHDRRCPLCGTDTMRIHSPVTRLLEKLNTASPLHRRWCVTCGWQGLVRVRPHVVLPALANPTHVPVRTLHFAGMQWRVLLQCWQENGQYCGQLLFIGPAGHLRRDPKHPFTGSTRAEIVDQALSLSDGLLTYRLRELVSD
jgi:hypothetical protein